jgi:HSP20 family protein
MSSMNLIHRRPASHPILALRDAERAFNHLHRRMVRPSSARPFQIAQQFVPNIEAVELETAYEISAELPGVSRDDLDVSVQDGVLTIKGARKLKSRSSEPAPAALADDAVTTGDTQAEDPGSEVQASEPAENEVKFERRIRFNGEIDEQAVKAKYVDGVLEVTVPKLIPAEPEVRSIPVEVA